MTTPIGIKLSLGGEREVEAGLRRVSGGMDTIGTAATSLRGGLAGLAGALGAALGVKEVLSAADAVTTLNNQLKLATGGAQQAAAAYSSLYEIAQRSRTSFVELGGTFATITTAAAGLGVSQQRMLGITEAIANAVTISGASAQASQAALMQLGQGLASGTLRGEELNSVMEQTPRLAKALADGLGVTRGELRELGAQGKITAEQVIKALESQAGVLSGEVKNATLTVGQAFTVLTNASIRTVGDFDKASGASATLAKAIGTVAQAVDALGGTIRENETTFKVLAGGVGGVAVVAGAAAFVSALKTVGGAISALGAVMAANPAVLVLLGIAAIGGAGAVALEASTKTAAGIQRAIDSLIQENQRSEEAMARAVEGGRQRGADNIAETIRQRREQIAKFRAELQQTQALAMGAGINTSIEDAKMAAAGQRARDQEERNKYLGESTRQTPAQIRNDEIKKAEKRNAELVAKAEGNTNEVLKLQAALRTEIANINEKHKDKKDESGAELKKQETGYVNLITSINAKIAAEKQEMENGGQLTVAQQVRIDLDKELAAGKLKLSDAQRKVVEERIAELSTAEAAKNLALAELKAIADLRDARLQEANARIKSTADASADNQTMRDEIALIGLSEDAQERILQSRRAAVIATKEATLAEMERKSAISGTMTVQEFALKEEIQQLKERNELLGVKYDRTTTAKAAEDITSEMRRASDQVNQSLTDALLRGFESGKGFAQNFRDTLKNMFNTLVLRPVISAILSPVSGTISGLLGGGGGSGGGAGNLLGLASNANSAYSLATGGLTGVGGSITGFGNMVGSQTISSFGYGVSGLAGPSQVPAAAAAGANAAGGLAGIGQTVMAAAPYLAAAFVALNALGVFRSEKKTDVGIKGTVGYDSSLAAFTTIRKGGTLFSGPSYRDDTAPLPDATRAALDSSIKSVFDSVAGYADVLGLNAKAIDGFTKDVFISTEGLSDTQVQEKLAAVFKGLGDDLANIVAGGILSGATTGSAVAAAAIAEDAAGALPLGVGTNVPGAGAGQTVSSASALDPFRKAGETSIDTLARLAGSLSSVNAVLDSLDQAALKASLAGGAAASALVDVFGGLDKFQAAASSFLQNFYTDDERRDVVKRQLGSTFDSMDIAMPTTRAAFRDLVEAQDLTTESGRKTYATLLSLSDAFASITEAATTSAAALAAEQAEKRASVQDQIDELSGNGRAVVDRRRGLEYAAAAADPALQKLIVSLWELQDATAAAATATAQAEKRASVQDEIDELSGNGRAVVDRQRGLEYAAAAADPALQKLIVRLWELQDATAAAAAAAEQAEKRASVQDQIDELSGNGRAVTDRRRGIEYAAAAADPALQKLIVRLWELEDATAAAAASAEKAEKRASVQDQIDELSGNSRAVTDRRRAIEYAAASADPELQSLLNTLWLLQDATARVDAAFATLERSVSARIEALQVVQQTAQETVGTLSTLFDTLKSNIRDLYQEVDATRAMSLQQAAAFVANAVGTVRTTGALPKNDDLSSAIASLRGGMDDKNFATRADADRARLVLAAQLDELGRYTGEQLSTAEQQVKLAEDEIKRLDDMLKFERTQIELARGQIDATVTVADAIEALHKSMFPPAAAKPGAGTTGGAVVGAGPSGGSAGVTGSALGRQGNGSYVFSDGYVTRDIAGAEAARLAGLDAIYAKWAGTGDVAGYYSAAKAAGFTLRDVAAHDGFFYGDVLAAAAAAGIPAFAVGTNYVPRDMLAQIHEGEAIVPRAYNPAANPGMGDMSQAGFARLLEAQLAGNSAFASAVSLLRKVQTDIDALRSGGIQVFGSAKDPLPTKAVTA
ncbi:tape measure protein [Xylophilus ampelinus]|uniref:Tape measure domain-containing protein n=1 Tax=Xylophilus ampelinus TaxID=54067 RepID=A0A318SKP9_9BURK|nr:tape measure protein [Xylophilus ampelinus]MCS4508887.1 tape measure protein [Xylophilus ampelinus]PYE79456.1 tape measure domain-containing protein [Xylophilus ampelinus]